MQINNPRARHIMLRILESLSKQFTICKLQELDHWIVSKTELFSDVTSSSLKQNHGLNTGLALACSSV